MSSIFGSPAPRRLFMHLVIADAGRDDQLTHDRYDPVHSGRTCDREAGWQQTVARVLGRRRTAIARGLQRWACRLEQWLRQIWGLDRPVAVM